MSRIKLAVDHAIHIAKDNYHGYSQTRRNTDRDDDCSTIVLDGLEVAGFDIGDATYTGNMLAPLLRAGFVDVAKSVDLRTGDGLKYGDILLRPKTAAKNGHTAFYIGDGKIVQAQSDYDGKPGDSSGREIRIQAYYDSPFTYVLRYPDPVEAKPTGAFGKIVNVREWCHRRAKPTSASASVGIAKFGDDVFINGKRMVNGKIWYHDSIGNWIWGEFVEIDDGLVPWM